MYIVVVETEFEESGLDIVEFPDLAEAERFFEEEGGLYLAEVIRETEADTTEVEPELLEPPPPLPTYVPAARRDPLNTEWGTEGARKFAEALAGVTVRADIGDTTPLDQTVYVEREPAGE